MTQKKTIKIKLKKSISPPSKSRKTPKPKAIRKNATVRSKTSAANSPASASLGSKRPCTLCL